MTDFTLIATQQLGVAASSVTFASLGAYRHLQIVADARSTRVNVSDSVYVQFNGDTGANYYREMMMSMGNNAVSEEARAVTEGRLGVITGASAPANATGSIVAFIPDYRGTTFHKSVVSRFGWKEGIAGNDKATGLEHTLWLPAVIAAITSIVIFPSTGNFVAGSVFSLYGLS